MSAKSPTSDGGTSPAAAAERCASSCAFEYCLMCAAAVTPESLRALAPSPPSVSASPAAASAEPCNNSSSSARSSRHASQYACPSRSSTSTGTLPSSQLWHINARPPGSDCCAAVEFSFNSAVSVSAGVTAGTSATAALSAGAAGDASGGGKGCSTTRVPKRCW
ncbi:hypothetical protein JKP88DRAFT_215951 [Tribonema minus]|uniref:Uncharacterized protein n=1 Tax=Tribonema minus TaxID=303371 RepID=A0A835YMU8_9STRA|nr:hypothetical protein JKP88DRAFT_215951 [Tribonema minus]